MHDFVQNILIAFPGQKCKTKHISIGGDLISKYGILPEKRATKMISLLLTRHDVDTDVQGRFKNNPAS